MVNKHIY